MRPFGVRLPPRVGPKAFAEAAHQSTRNDAIMHAGITALLEALASIEAQLAKLDCQFKELAGCSAAAWRLMSVPSIGPVTALAYIAAIEDPHRFQRRANVYHSR